MRRWVILCCLVLCACGKTSPPALGHLRIGLTAEPSSALPILMSHRHTLERAGVSVDVVRYANSAQSLQAVVEGRVDVAFSVDIPMVLAALDGGRFKILATVAMIDADLRIVSRSDRGIATVEDLVGKRVASQRAGTSGYCLHRLLDLHGLPCDQVVMVDLPAEDMLPLLTTGEIDAGCVEGDRIDRVVAALGVEAATFSAPGGCMRSTQLIVRADLPAPMAHVLIASLLEAEVVMQADQSAVQGVVADFLGLQPDDLTTAWQRTRYSVGLDQGLLESLERVQDWVIRHDLRAHAAPVDFLDIIDCRPMDAIAPGRVTVVH